jgi:hypothetical protein
MPETASPAVDFSTDADLISFLKAIPDSVDEGDHWHQPDRLQHLMLGYGDEPF